MQKNSYQLELPSKPIILSFSVFLYFSPFAGLVIAFPWQPGPIFIFIRQIKNHSWHVAGLYIDLPQSHLWMDTQGHTLPGLLFRKGCGSLPGLFAKIDGKQKIPSVRRWVYRHAHSLHVSSMSQITFFCWHHNITSFICLVFLVPVNDIFLPDFHGRQEHHALCITEKCVCVPLESDPLCLCLKKRHWAVGSS